MTENMPTTLSRTLDSAILLAMLSALAFATSFAFECGYAGYFGIPALLVEANPKNLLICGAIFVFGMPSVWQSADFLVSLWPKKWPDAIRRATVITMSPLVLMLVARVFLGTKWSTIAVIGLPATALFGLIEFACPLLAHSDKPGYVAKLDANFSHQAGQSQKSPGLVLMLINRVGPERYRQGMLVLSFIPLAWAFGFREARLDKQFLVANAPSPCVIVSSFNDTLLCVSFDRVSRKVTGHYRLIPVKESMLDLQLESVGPLSSSWSMWADDEEPKTSKASGGEKAGSASAHPITAAPIPNSTPTARQPQTPSTAQPTPKQPP